ncbi:putative Protein-glutamate O-methyltransferase [Candidatus Sulfobium mesophilum]|uniref:histidine kinase n=1 Tax=Candidatus Sulfobium mesophilum TaxID=2016548 RepID=A0A2U3QKV0_9BACT|nr:putative Protein-glutamate O-methyltransferase [Candidatus Sulfobium mesophilum]
MAPKKSSNKLKSTSVSTKQPGTRSSNSSQFPIVGVGASAGGLEAFTQLFKYLPADPGMAFVLIQHLAPAHESMLTALLSKSVTMPVREVKDGMTVESDNVYVIPPDTEMVIFQGVLHLTPREKTRGQYMPVDSFLRSLAQDRGNNAMAIILSGSGSDGSNGIRAIKGEGGIVFAQDETAKYDGMPKSAADTGCVDLVLPPDKIAAELLRIRLHPYLAAVEHGEPVRIIQAEENDLNKIFIMLRSAKGVDFTSYKRSTIMRRVNRRMLLQKINGMEAYVAYLKANPSEIETLYQDILINVTSFFREPGAFEALRKSVFPHIVNKAAGDAPVRIWVPACSTGEEAYSIAIALIEYMDENKISRPFQLFATDIDDIAVEKARKGIYPENISNDISTERLGRFFEKSGDAYVINKRVREMCIFAKHNMVKDPPFSKIDFISCRNVLIYFGAELQKKTVRILFYALNPKGFLMIGPFETVGEFDGLFSVVDKRGAIYAKRAEPSMHHFEAPAVEYGKEKADGKRAEGQPAGVFNIQKEADNIVIANYSPAGFVVNEAMTVLQFRGNTGPFLMPASGEASLDLMKMVSEDLVVELRTALYQAKKEDVPVKKKRARVERGKLIRYINIDVVPFKAPASGERYFLVLLEEIGYHSRPRSGPVTGDAARLRQELAASKAHLNTVTREYEAANEELRALNEELQSSNEEMQSINEEMETAKEELQSTNEELTTVNDELRSRSEETTQLNNDLSNVLRGVEIPIIILGSKLEIRRFNEAAARLLNLIPSDTGRPLSNIRTNINIPDLEQMVLETIHTLAVKEKEVQDMEGRWYSVKIRPYKTVDNRIDGVLMTLVDVDDMKRNLLRVEGAYDYANAIVETVREPLLVLTPDLRVITANKSFYANFLVDSEETVNRFIYDLGNGRWNIPALRNLLEKVLPEDKAFSDFEVELELPNIGRRVMMLNAREIYLDEPYLKTALNTMESFDRLILLAIEDITGRKRAESITQARLRMLSMAASPSGSRDETLQMMLDEIEKQTGSTIGFYHFLNVDQETLSLQAWSTNTLRDMCSAEGKGSHYNISQAGVWVDCVRQRGPVIHNDYVSLANRKGFPPGHAAVKREMVVPVLRDGRIVAIIGVGNKPTDYNATDVEIAESLGQLSWEIFERIRAVDELQAAYAEAERRAKELELAYKDMEGFSYSVSHDLRAPLRIIKGMSDIVLKDHYDKLDDEGKVILERIHGNTEKMDQLINALLDLSRISRLEIKIEEIDMEKETALIAADLNASAPERNINMDIKKLPPAYGDITLIRQVLTNLLSNAVKFTKDRDVASIEIGGRSGNGENIYYVKDNGAGFNTDYADKLFGVFQRLHSAKEFEGIGIGLSIVQRIIQRHGGRVWAEGETGKGATFYFTLQTTAGGGISETSE